MPAESDPMIMCAATGPSRVNQIARTANDSGNGLTQTELASRTGVFQRTISNIESSASAARLATIFNLAAALDPRSTMKPGDGEGFF